MTANLLCVADECGRAAGHRAPLRREEVGLSGFDGASTEAIARRVGVSQPYLFRLFPTKKAMFLATVNDCFDRVQALFEEAAEGLAGEEALKVMGRSSPIRPPEQTKTIQ